MSEGRLEGPRHDVRLSDGATRRKLVFVENEVTGQRPQR